MAYDPSNPIKIGTIVGFRCTTYPQPGTLRAAIVAKVEDGSIGSVRLTAFRPTGETMDTPATIVQFGENTNGCWEYLP